jgi:tryptophanyl-tRNA synthetase
MKRIFSGVQPSGSPTLGNYIGAFQHFVRLQDEADETIYCVVDLHAITVPQDPEQLHKRTREVAMIYLACGIDPQRSLLFVQSQVSAHAELAWILNCFTSMGELSRQTQFKDKSRKGEIDVSVGLFDYPTLMAADILLYDTTHVPVGEDQKQHVELSRDLAQRVNRRFGKDLFVVPQPELPKQGKRIMSLDNPANKMDKSASSENSYILLLDPPDLIRNKIKRAVTDSDSEIKSGADKPALTNLLTIFSECSGRSVQEIEKEFSGKGYGDFKAALADAVVEKLTPIQQKYRELEKNPDELDKILTQGAERARKIADKKLAEVKTTVGLG